MIIYSVSLSLSRPDTRKTGKCLVFDFSRTTAALFKRRQSTVAQFGAKYSQREAAASTHLM